MRFPPRRSEHTSGPGGSGGKEIRGIGGSGGVGGIRRIGGTGWNGGVLICGTITLCKLRTRPTAIRMYSDTVAVPRLLVAMLENANYSATLRPYSTHTHSQYTTKERESDPTSYSRSHSRRPSYSDLHQYSGQLVSQATSSVQHMHLSKIDNIVL